MSLSYQHQGRERSYPDNVRLISTTDLNGQITYANKEFCDVAGYTEEELIGQHHNIVRHPEMPKDAFNDLWSHLKNDKPWMGMVKNRCKDGDYYWVQAYVMPLFDEQGQKTGYQSVRTRPTREQVERAEQIYSQLQSGRIKAPGNTTNLAQRFVIGATGLTLLMVSLALVPAIEAFRVPGIMLTVLLITGFSYHQYRALVLLSQHTSEVYENPLAQMVMADRMDDIGSAQLALQMMRARLRTLTGRVEDSIEILSRVLNQTDGALKQTTSGIQQQNCESDMLASAATQMSATATQVAASTSHTSDASQRASLDAQDGKEQVSEMINAVQNLVDEVHIASDSSEHLREQTVAIGDIVTMISDIAEQTNLLALNAAIEAARAGDQGRGFAVVADEVRTLAQRTQKATHDIRKTIETIQIHVNSTATTMERSRNKAETGISQAVQASKAFDQVVVSMTSISDHSMQIASAAEQQSTVSEEISKNIVSIREIAQSNMSAADETTQASRELQLLVKDLKSSVQAFST